MLMAYTLPACQKMLALHCNSGCNRRAKEAPADSDHLDLFPLEATPLIEGSIVFSAVKDDLVAPLALCIYYK